MKFGAHNAGTQLWFIRAGQGAREFDGFFDEGVVGVGWCEAGPLDAAASDAEFAKAFAETYPDWGTGKRNAGMATVKRFLREIAVGDEVATYDPRSRRYILGTIESEPQWRDAPLGRFRRVKWTHECQRDWLSPSTRNSLGAISSMFRPSAEASDELRSRSVPIGSGATAVSPAVSRHTPESDESEAVSLLEDVAEKADEFVEDRLAKLSWDEFQDLIAGILRAMGYRTSVAGGGPDRGVDVFASPDGLGLEEPRIFVEVKHRRGTTISAPDVRSFLGGRKAGDRCLYVSTGGFTREARYEAERSTIPLTLLALPEVRELLIDNYDKLDDATRALVPLKRIYWPVE